MASNKVKMFKSLYYKDLREVRIEILIVAIAALVSILWVYGKTEGDSRMMIMVPAMALMGLAGFLPIITSFRLLGREWGQNTIYLLMSLPVSGAMMLGSKLLVLLTEYLAGTLLVGMVAAIAIFISFPELALELSRHPDLMLMIKILLSTYLASIAGIILVFSCSFLSQLFARLFSRASGLITVVIFFFLLIGVGRLTPEVSLNITYPFADISSQIAFLWMHIGILLVFALLLLAASVWLWERRIQL